MNLCVTFQSLEALKVCFSWVLSQGNNVIVPTMTLQNGCSGKVLQIVEPSLVYSAEAESLPCVLTSLHGVVLLRGAISLHELHCVYYEQELQNMILALLMNLDYRASF